MGRRSPRKVTYFEPVAPRLARNTVIESTFGVGRRFLCMMRIEFSWLDPCEVIWPVPGEWHPHMPAQLDEEELAEWRAGRRHGLSARGAHDRYAHRGRRGLNRIPPKKKTRRGEHRGFEAGDRNWASIARAGNKQHRSAMFRLMPVSHARLQEHRPPIYVGQSTYRRTSCERC
jgi:hypothetical protein